MPEANEVDEVVHDGHGESIHDNDVIQRLADEIEADIFVVSGGIDRRLADWVLEFFDRFENTRPNVVVFLCTFGGDPNAAYVIASTFKRIYEKFSLTFRVIVKVPAQLSLSELMKYGWGAKGS